MASGKVTVSGALPLPRSGGLHPPTSLLQEGYKLANSPWFKLFSADFLLDPDVDEIPLEAQGILVRMWCVCWMDGFILDDPAQIARKCRIVQTVVQNHMQNLRKFFLQSDSKLISERMEQERSKSKIISAARKQAALKSHENRPVSDFADSFADAKEPANDGAKLGHSDVRCQMSDAQSNSKPESKSKPSSRSASTDALFDKAYEQYPRRVGKRAASTSWTNAVNRAWGADESFGRPQAEEMIYQRVMTYAAVCERTHKEKQFIPHMATWLNQDRFMDDPSDWAVQEKTNGAGTHKTTTGERNQRNMEAIVSVALGNRVRGDHVPDSGAVQHGTDRDGGRKAGSISDPEILAREPKRT